MRGLLPFLLATTSLFAADNYFPPPDRAVGWRSDEIEAWIESRPRAQLKADKLAAAADATAG